MASSELPRPVIRFAEEHSVAPERIAAVLERIKCFAEAPEALQSGPKPRSRKPHATHLLGHIQKAAEQLGIDDALSLFEREDPKELWERVHLTQEIAEMGAPLFTIDELSKVTRDLVIHLEENRPSLLKTGFPKTVFRRSLWHDIRLTNHFFTKLPISVRSASDGLDLCWPRHPVNQRIKAHRPEPHAAFKIPLGGYWTDDSRAEAEGYVVDERGLYEKAPGIDGVKDADAERLESMRERLLDLKINFLRVLERTIADRDRDCIWEKATRIFSDDLDSDEAEFLLGMDVFYLSFDIRSGTWKRPLHASMPLGGLTEMLMVLGHYERELKLGALDLVKRWIDESSYSVRGKTYYEVIREGRRGEWDGVLGLYRQARVLEAEFWSSFRERLNHWLQGDFEITIRVEEKVPRDRGEVFVAWAQAFVGMGAAHLKQFDAVPDVKVGGTPLPRVEVLAPEEEKEHLRHQYRTKVSVIVTGLLDGYGRNQIRVDGEPLCLASGEFKLFLRLISENDLGKGGWIQKQTLDNEGILEESDYREVSRLRKSLGKQAELVETSKGAGFRLSTHRSMIRLDFEKLKQHEDKSVRSLAKAISRRKRHRNS